MARLHFFEWEDQPWFPKLFRNFITDHLAFHVSRLYIPLAPKLSELMRKTNHTKIIDLCSGGSGPLSLLLPECTKLLGQQVTATLTDLYPNTEAFEQVKKNNDSIDYHSEPVSAMNCPESLHGVRTIFSALHHFRPNDAKKILTDAIKKRVPIGAFETTERNIPKLIIIPIVVFLSGFILTPFVGRMTFGRFVFTYLIPLMPFFYTWDGVISCLRTYTPKELGELVAELQNESYHWEYGTIDAVGHIGPYKITYLIGSPANTSEK